jgi:hypothetical protein
MMLGVELAGLGGMMGGVGMMAVRDLGVVRGLFDILVAMMRGGVTVVFRGLFVMFGGFFVVFGDAFAGHCGSFPRRGPDARRPRLRAIPLQPRCG